MAKILQAVKWERMLAWTVLCSVLLFSPMNCDFTSHHLRNYLNYSVSPCADFHKHVCSIALNDGQIAIRKSELYCEKLAPKLGSRSRNNAIMNDIYSARALEEGCLFDAESYKSDLHTRCGSLFDCYLAEFNYFFNVFDKSDIPEVPATLKFFSSHANRTEIPRIVHVTAKMIEAMIEMATGEDFDTFVSPYEHLHDHLFLMPLVRMKTKKFGLRKMESRIRQAIANRFMETPWLNETDEFDLDRLSQFLTTLDEIRIFIDFDKLDADISVWRRMDRLITAKYFEYSQRTTGCSTFDVMHPFITLKKEVESNNESEHWIIFDRMKYGLIYNAFNMMVKPSIGVLAPNFYPFMWENSSDTTQLGFAGSVLGHEIFHSFIKNDQSNEIFQQEAECMKAHFNQSCAVWAEGICNSGEQTWEEDAPDVEGMRVAYDILIKTFSEEQLQEFEYEDLKITRNQAFFYAYALRECHGKTDHDHADVHSADFLRLNGAVALMPEFTAAFGCQQEDEEYSEESTSCYMFGPLAGSDRGEETNQETHDSNDEVDGSGEETTDSAH